MQNKMVGKVLVVDDEEDFRSTVEAFLIPHFTEVATAENGLEALDIQKNFKADVIISDLKMPKMSGQKLLESLRELHDETPFIILTGFGDMEAAILALRFGAFDFLTKPFSEEHLLDKVKEAIKMKKIMLEAEKEVLSKKERGELPEKMEAADLLLAKHVAFLKKVKTSLTNS